MYRGTVGELCFCTRETESTPREMMNSVSTCTGGRVSRQHRVLSSFLKTETKMFRRTSAGRRLLSDALVSLSERAVAIPCRNPRSFHSLPLSRDDVSVQISKYCLHLRVIGILVHAPIPVLRPTLRCQELAATSKLGWPTSFTRHRGGRNMSDMKLVTCHPLANGSWFRASALQYGPCRHGGRGP